MDPRARIEAFLADYAAAHAEVKPLFDKWKEEDPFPTWFAKTAALRASHQLERSLKGDIAGFSEPAAFSPEAVTIERIDVYGTSAMARLARSRRAMGDPIIEMMLVRVGDDWRIDTIDDYDEEPGSPLVDKDVLEAWKAAADKTSPMEAQHKEDMPDPAALRGAQ